jgi:hypothetical protein
MYNKFLGSWELENVGGPLQLLEFARAYLCASKLLCKNINKLISEARYADGCVVIFTAYHAVELFLKGMILYKSPEASLHHDVEKLAKDYHRLYREEKYIWNVPFGISVLGDTKEAERQIEQVKRELPQDQLYRYPINRKGRAWAGAFAFEPSSFMRDVILPLEYDFDRLEKQLKTDFRALERAGSLKVENEGGWGRGAGDVLENLTNGGWG